jgi:hypothetical protein
LIPAHGASLAVRDVGPLELVHGEVLGLGVDGHEAPRADDAGTVR